MEGPLAVRGREEGEKEGADKEEEEGGGEGKAEGAVRELRETDEEEEEEREDREEREEDEDEGGKRALMASDRLWYSSTFWLIMLLLPASFSPVQ